MSATDKAVIFRLAQEVTPDDLNNIGGFAGAALDRIVGEGLTDEKKFSKFEVTKSGTTEVTIAPGTYWVEGKRYIREVSHVIDFIGNLPLTTKKIAAVIVTSNDIETSVDQRDFEIDVDTGATEPRNVAMEALRYADFQVAYGTESPTPQKPTISSGALVIAWVTLSTTGVDGVERASENEFMSTKKLSARATELEVWRQEAGEQITTLGTDISTLADRVSQMADSTALARIFTDMAVVKAALELEADYSGYDAENFLEPNQMRIPSDTDAVGYYAKVEEGLRPPDANADNVAIALFNPQEPSVKVASNGLCLPAYSEVRRIAVDRFYQQYSISQFEYQEVEFKKITMSARRLRFGLAKTVCNNSEFWKTGSYDSRSGVFTDKLGRTYQTLNNNEDVNPSRGGFLGHAWIRLQQFWYDTEVEYYQDRVVTDFTVNGSMIAQTFLNTQAGWLTSLDFFLPQVANDGNLRVLVTKTAGGKPDLSRVIGEVTIAAANLVRGTDASVATEWTRASFIPTALEAGERYAIVLVTGGDHYVGLAQGATYAAGTLFSSTDGAFFQGDLTLDMMFKANFAQFANTRAEVDLASLNLSGGINDIDIGFEGVVPGATELFFEVRPQGSSRWYRLDAGEDNPFTGLPALVNFRAVFIGTKDNMPAIRLTDSDVLISRPATNFTWFSEPIALPAPSQSIKVVWTLDRFNETNHDFTVTISDITNTVNDIAPASVTDEVLDERDGTRKRIRRTCEWSATELTIGTDEFTIKAVGALTAATEVFHGERLVYLSF